MDNLIVKLERDFNFQLSLKSIQATDKNVLIEIQKELSKINKTSVIIEDKNIYDQLKRAYDNKIDYILIDDYIKVLVPLVVVITNDCADIIKPTVPVYYCLKDNKIIQKVKTQCNKKMTNYSAFKTNADMIKQIVEMIKEVN